MLGTLATDALHCGKGILHHCSALCSVLQDIVVLLLVQKCHRDAAFSFQAGVQHVVLTLGAAGAALATLERRTDSSGSGGGAELSGGRRAVRITYMPVRSPAWDALQLL